MPEKKGGTTSPPRLLRSKIAEQGVFILQIVAGIAASAAAVAHRRSASGPLNNGKK
jgi:hypothetical protein